MSKNLRSVSLSAYTVQLKRKIIDSSGRDVAVTFSYHYVANLALLDLIWLKTGTGHKKRFILMHSLATEYDL